MCLISLMFKILTQLIHMRIPKVDIFRLEIGIVGVSSDPKVTVLAYPDKTKGYVRVKSYDKNQTALINAHESEIANMTLNAEGTILATASDKVIIIINFINSGNSY